ncbi:MAG: hypothetical protein PHS80_01230 [Methanothrix sp.]|nr:hypothetical protein [Methanothrix sp.]
MQTLLPQELLNVWEQGTVWPAAVRALKLLALAFPKRSLQELEKMCIGERDSLLLMLREETFGSHLVCLAVCRDCNERMEVAFSVQDILVDPAIKTGEVLSIAVSGYEVWYRLVCGQDLIAIAGIEDPTKARSILLDRCILAVRYNNENISEYHPVDELPIDVLNAVVDGMEQADPQADVQISLTCSSCGQQWQASFDIVSFFWSEIDNWAHRILRDVHTLARAYGWSESDILEMSPLRRQIYLEMASE